jgi:hypothetical protein
MPAGSGSTGVPVKPISFNKAERERGWEGCLLWSQACGWRPETVRKLGTGGQLKRADLGTGTGAAVIGKEGRSARYYAAASLASLWTDAGRDLARGRVLCSRKS